MRSPVALSVGSSASRFAVGARVDVATTVASRRIWTACQAGHKNYSLNGNTQTYGAKDKDGIITRGGYSNLIV